jgi:hypothetical protein
MFYIVYRSDTGAMVSSGTVIATPLPDGLAAVPYESAPDFALVQWDATQRMLVPRPPRVRSTISRQTFMDRLGDACLVAVHLAAQGTTGQAAALRAWLLRFQVVSDIDVLDPRTIAGVDALIAAGLLDAARRDAVLATVPM